MGRRSFIAVIKAAGLGACHPTIMVTLPFLMDKSGLSIVNFDPVEVNEAFTAQNLAGETELDLNREITKP